MNYRIITVTPKTGPAIYIFEHFLDNRDLPDMTDASGKTRRDQLIAEGTLTPYAEDTSDYGFDRPTLTSAAVQTLRERLIRSGNLVVGEATRSYVDEKDGRTYHYEANLSLPTPIQLDDDQE